MRRLLSTVLALTLSLLGILVLPLSADAAPLPAAYSGSAGGDVLAFDLNVPGGVDLADARLAVTESAVSGGATPQATSTASNLAVVVAGLGITVQSETQTAPPDHPTATTGTILAATAQDLLDLGALSTSVQARTQAAVACTPNGGVLADSRVQSAGSTLEPTGVGNVVTTGDSSTRGTVALVPEPAGDPLNRAVRSVASGTITDTSFLDGQVTVGVSGTSTLTARATGETGGADVVYQPGDVTVTAAGATVTVDAGATSTFDVPGGQVVVTVNDPTVTEAADGQTATGAVAVVTVAVRVGAANDPLATATVDLLPLRAEAVAPAGGIDCAPPAPVLVDPADGSTTEDLTPTFTGTGVPGAEVEIFVDGDSIGTTTVDGDGNFSFTPTDPLPIGPHTATAVQTTAGGPSQPSNANDFTIEAAVPRPPVLVDPADGSATDDTTPEFTGTAPAGSTVEIFVDGDSIGRTTAEDDGTFSFTPTTPLAEGPHRASATATVDGVESAPSNSNDFLVDATAPDAPVITSPTDGSSTTDPDVPITGIAEPGSEVIIVIDGEEAGSTVADEDGRFSFVPPSPLSKGRHRILAIALDEAGNESEPSDEVAVTVVRPAAGTGSTGSTGSGAVGELARTGGPGGWLAVLAGLFLTGGATALVGARRRRRAS